MENTDEEKVSALITEESSTDFLARLGTSLQESANVDVDLANILTELLLTAAPAKDAVTKAKSAIHKLALERADPPKSEVSYE
jgi:hypothetical protein